MPDTSRDSCRRGKDAFVAKALALPLVGQPISERSVMVEGDCALVFATTKRRLAGAAGAAETVPSGRSTCACAARGGQWRMRAPRMQQFAAK